MSEYQKAIPITDAASGVTVSFFNSVSFVLCRRNGLVLPGKKKISNTLT